MGEISSMVADAVTSQLLTLSAQSSRADPAVHHSQGGHVEAGDTITTCSSSSSRASSWWDRLGGERRHAHLPRGAPRGPLRAAQHALHDPSAARRRRGRAADLQIEAEEILKARERLNKTIADATGQPLAKVRKDTDRNFWMSPTEAREYGIVGTIVASAAELPR
jgi:ATP-dependent Clp protease protease subunit